MRRTLQDCRGEQENDERENEEVARKWNVELVLTEKVEKLWII
jgi:hypothetical protein